MLETLATLSVLALGLYLVVGLVFALWFAWRGANRIDPSAREGSWGFRLLILPGSAALWPFLLRRVRSGEPPRESNAHRDAAGETSDRAFGPRR